MPQKHRGDYHQPHLKAVPSADGTRDAPRVLRAQERVVGRRPVTDSMRPHHSCADEDPLPPAA